MSNQNVTGVISRKIGVVRWSFQRAANIWNITPYFFASARRATSPSEGSRMRA
jgi:hypothetical protein